MEEPENRASKQEIVSEARSLMLMIARYVVTADVFGTDFPFMFARNRDELIASIDIGDDDDYTGAVSELLMNVLGYSNSSLRKVTTHFQITEADLDVIYDAVLDIQGFYLLAASDELAELFVYLMTGEAFGDMSAEEFLHHFKYDKADYMKRYRDLCMENYRYPDRLCECVGLVYHYYEQHFDFEHSEVSRYFVGRERMKKHYAAWAKHYCKSE